MPAATTVRLLVASALATVALAVGSLPASASSAQYIPELPTTTESLLPATTDVGHAAPAASGDGNLPGTGWDSSTVARVGVVLLVVGGLLMMAPARRSRRERAAIDR